MICQRQRILHALRLVPPIHDTLDSMLLPMGGDHVLVHIPREV